ncbi:MAG: hypothetical protein M3P18_07570, partial [Actinomycetota bacterium]|nr:hypothetical protein [Actinomycetota bacterium]
ARMSKSNPRAWDGYLVLLCAEEATRLDQELASRIRNDTAHVRKFVAGAQDLQALVDVARVLLPLTPIDLPPAAHVDRDALLERLPSLLAEGRTDQEVVRQVVEAFRRGEPVMEALDRALHL